MGHPRYGELKKKRERVGHPPSLCPARRIVDRLKQSITLHNRFPFVRASRVIKWTSRKSRMFITSRIAAFYCFSTAILAVFLPFVSALLWAMSASVLLLLLPTLAVQRHLSPETGAFPSSPCIPTVLSRAPPALVFA